MLPSRSIGITAIICVGVANAAPLPHTLSQHPEQSVSVKKHQERDDDFPLTVPPTRSFYNIPPESTGVAFRPFIPAQGDGYVLPLENKAGEEDAVTKREDDALTVPPTRVYYPENPPATSDVAFDIALPADDGDAFALPVLNKAEEKKDAAENNGKREAQ